jgi:hypothetical protein
MVSLLRDGFGFAPNRDITFCFLVDGSEVEWSLGYALSQHAEQRRLDASSERGTDSNTTQEGCVDTAMETPNMMQNQWRTPFSKEVRETDDMHPFIFVLSRKTGHHHLLSRCCHLATKCQAS